MKKTIKTYLITGLKTEIITNEEFTAMCPSDKGPGKFYELFKVHKDHESPYFPPERPIVSGCEYVGQTKRRLVDRIKEMKGHESMPYEVPYYIAGLFSKITL